MLIASAYRVTMVMYAGPKHKVPASWCLCREILSRRRGFICMTGAKPCPHCGLRVPARLMREIPMGRSDR